MQDEVLITEPLALSATIAAIAALGFWLDHRFRWARRVGPSMVIIALGAVVGNLGLVPEASPVYDFVTGPLTSLAIVWLLLAVDMADVRAAGPRMLAAFGIAVLATMTGALAASALFAERLGDDTWRLAGVMTATYAGGSLNFAAVGRAVELPESLYGAAAASDSVLTAVWLGANLLLPLWLARFYPPADARLRRGRSPRAVSETVPGGSAASEAGKRTEAELAAAAFRPRDLSALLAIGLLVMVAAEAVGRWMPGVPGILWLTTLALATSLLPGVRSLRGAMALGILALHVFFVVIGIGSRIAEILAVGPWVFLFTATVVGVHGLFVYGFARLARLDVETTSVASQAAIGGPSTAIAVAVARGWPGLVVPGLAVGLLGYALGNYAGVLVAAWVRG